MSVDEYERVVERDERGRVRRSYWQATGNSFPLKRQKAELIDLPKETDNERLPVTVAASCPRAGSGDPAAGPDPDILAAADAMAQSIHVREHLPEWATWCQERRERVKIMRTAPHEDPARHAERAEAACQATIQAVRDRQKVAA